MKNRKRKADVIREERKRQMMKFIEKKRMKILSAQSFEKSPLKENKNITAPFRKKEEKPKEVEKTYINGSSRRKKRREKLAEVAAQKEEIRKKNVLAQQQERQKKLEERSRKKLEALKAREDIRLRRELEKKTRVELAAQKTAAVKLAKEQKRNARLALAAEKAAVKIEREKVRERSAGEKAVAVHPPVTNVTVKKTTPPEIRNAQSLKKREELFARLSSIKEKQDVERQQKLLQKQLALAERKVSVIRRDEEKKRKRTAALKAREEAQLRKEEENKARLAFTAEKAVKLTEKSEIPEKIILPPAIFEDSHAKRKEQLLEFIRSRKLLAKQDSERRKTLKSVVKEKKAKVIPTPVPAPVPMPVAKPSVVEKLQAPARVAAPAKSREEQKKISSHIAGLVNEANRISGTAVKSNVAQSVQSARKFIAGFRRKPAAAKEQASVRSAKKIVRYREPFHLLPFIRKNAFKFVFLLLCIGWFAEIFLLIRGFQEPQQRLKAIVGEELFTDRPSKSKQSAGEVVETEKFSISKPERIDIEGKRDPFSPGRLTMDVLDRPSPTRIVLAPRPEVISILRPSRTVSVIRREKQMEPDRIAEVTKPQTPSYQTILKSAPPSSVPAPVTLAPLEKPQKLEPSPLLMPEKRCDLVYRGRMLVEGVEYLFIEGKQKTYRVTVGDVVEGFRILRKESNKLHLSKDGILYEINLD